MIGCYLVFSYFLSIGYNTIMLDRIRKNTIKKCREKTEEKNFDINPSKINCILAFTPYGKNDCHNYFLSYMPFGSYRITYKLISGKMKREYDAVSEDILNQETLLILKRQQIISSPSILKTFTKEERVQLKKTHQIYKPGDSILTSSRERLLDGLPSNEQLSIEEVNRELDKKIEESKGKVLKKEMK